MSFSFRISVSILFMFYIVVASDVNKAYEAYLAGDYANSLALYTEVNSTDSESKDALYGIVNCHAALLQYDEALAWCDTLLVRGMDPLMVEKKMWLLGLTNNSREAAAFWRESAVKQFADERRRAIAMSCGWGFYGVGNYRTAEFWFGEAARLKEGVDVEQALLLNRQNRQKLRPDGSLSFYGGPILYSGQRIVDEKGELYSYKGGAFYGGEASVTFKKRHTFTLMASRFDAKLAEQEYYYEGDTLLVWDSVYTGTKLYGIEIDTLYLSLDEQFVGGVYNLQERIDSLEGEGFALDTAIAYDLNGFADTAYYLFKVDSLGELDSVDLNVLSYEKYDSVDWKDTVHWDSTVHWRDTVKVQPDPLWQNTVYVGYTGKRLGGKNITLGTGVQLFNSNMRGLKRGAVFWMMNRHSLKWFDFACNWYFTALESRRVAQANLQWMRQWGKLYVQLEPAMTFGISSDSGYSLPKVQHSLSLDLIYYLKRSTLFESLVIGGRQFTAESMGMNLVTVTEEHQFTSVSKAMVRPFKNEKISLLGILRFEKYNSFDRKIILGGVALTW